ncbi:basic amino acid/polyamine antiporter [Shewanella corallii]|uniref:Basic amino acid/polyamine antiporter n=1 Tax=Shewanella corallii TaxID=560080 RepID=A0ABT0N1N6_9GAMM|nr:basic amino acid/polyamine antiporter [Shewanella corallii]MCL2912344.1 basic amino acid/polyamine antiporter [Shewanella corallii]
MTPDWLGFYRYSTRLTMTTTDNKLGLGALCALVVGSIIGAGVFSLPQNMAAVASPLAVMIGWTITGTGMIFLALTFQRLCLDKPEINTGVFGYAKAGFGDLVGFFSCWGYWLSAVLANVSYLVIIFSTLGLFFDTPQHEVFGQGNTLVSALLASGFVWMIHFLLLRGVQTAAIINAVTTIAKLIPLFVFIVVAAVAFKLSTFTLDFSVVTAMPEADLMTQVKETMLITVWVFIGIEGAVVVSSRARNRKDVGRATIFGLLITLFIYVMVSLLSMGVITTTELAQMQNPSAAQVLKHILGPVGLWIVGLGLIVSVSGAYLSWTLLANESPYIGAREKMFPSLFGKTNSKGTPKNILLISNAVVQFVLIWVTIEGGTYESLLNVASEMILVPYLFVALYALKTGRQDGNIKMMLFGGMASVYGFWLLYAAGLHHLLLTSLLYFPGLAFYIMAKREYGEPWFAGNNRWIILGLMALAMTAAVVILF